jgi:hypothetical protein
LITGCYTNAQVNGSHAIVLQDAGTTCAKGTTAVSWSEEGPPGATGPAGPSTAGPGGLGIEVYSGGGEAFGYGNNLAVCPPDHPYAISGGVDADRSAVYQDEPAFFNTGTGQVTLGYMGNGNPAIPNAWFTQADGDNGGIAYVLCSQ